MADRDLRSGERDRGRSMPNSGNGSTQRVGASPPRSSRPAPDDLLKDRSVSRSRSGERKHRSKKSKSKKSKHHRDDEKKKRRRRSRSSSGSRSRSPDDNDSDRDRHRKKRSSRKRRRDVSSGSSRSRGSTDRSRSPSRSPPLKSKDSYEKDARLKEKGGERDYGRPVERGGRKNIYDSGSEDDHRGGGDRRRRDDPGDDRRGGDRRSGGNGYDDRAPRRPKLPVTRGTDEERMTTTHVFVGNIPYDYNDRDVGDLCEKYGNVASVTVPMDRATGKNRGYVFDSIYPDHALLARNRFSLEAAAFSLEWSGIGSL
ncbi:hypothetical protein BJ742DRAFT_294677 [Cladochytrium replicatum]|nr:hypothetical protein BJ742DRAFT_294677 [Cladochytrium replicatum]